MIYRYLHSGYNNFLNLFIFVEPKSKSIAMILNAWLRLGILLATSAAACFPVQLEATFKVTQRKAFNLFDSVCALKRCHGSDFAFCSFFLLTKTVESAEVNVTLTWFNWPLSRI